MNQTLHEWCLANHVTAYEHGTGAYYIPDRDYANRWELFHLSDFVVSSVRAGTIWLVRK